MFPLSSKQIAGTRNHDHPEGGAEKVKDEKLAPRHAQNSRHRAGDDPHPEHKARKEDCHRTIARKQPFAAPHGFVLDPENMLIATEQAPSPVVTGNESQIVAASGRDGRYQDDPRKRSEEHTSEL